MTQKLGSWGEKEAVHYLESKGYMILERNFNVLEGEIDVIAEKEDCIHFVEVKTRSSNRCGSPEQSLDLKKQRRLLRAGFEYLDRHLIEGWGFQFDLIAIECTPSREVIRLTHYQNVIGIDSI
ncbi:MAG: YraN family protein [Anaerolineales bacterium]|jgi:putative endonuclease